MINVKPIQNHIVRFPYINHPLTMNGIAHLGIISLDHLIFIGVGCQYMIIMPVCMCVVAIDVETPIVLNNVILTCPKSGGPRLYSYQVQCGR